MAVPCPSVQTDVHDRTNQRDSGSPDACETAQEAHRGYLKAMEYALRVALLTHPDPKQLSDVWTSLLPSIARTHQNEGGMFSAAFQQSLVLLTEQIGSAKD